MKNTLPEDTSRRRLRFVARILDYEVELKNMGWGQEILDDIRKNPIQAKYLHQKMSKALDSFTQKPLGYETELLKLFDKYDTLIKKTSDPKQRQAIGALGVMEVSKLLDDYSIGKNAQLTVNNEVVKTQEGK